MFLFILPALIINVLLIDKLPSVYTNDFWQNIPLTIILGENITRTLIILLPIFMPISIRTSIKKVGFVIYCLGMLLYIFSWIVTIGNQSGTWIQNFISFSAMAYTPLVWLMGIGMMSERLYMRSPYRPWMYLMLSLVFVIFHIYHTLIVYWRI